MTNYTLKDAIRWNYTLPEQPRLQVLTIKEGEPVRNAIGLLHKTYEEEWVDVPILMLGEPE